MKIITGLTGPTGSGKSFASTLATERGIKVINCDLLARKAVEKGSEGLKALSEAFTDMILFDDGTLNRKKLASIAFADKEKTLLLNKVIFPFITDLLMSEIKDYEKILLDAPTLFESGIDKCCYKTIAILSQNEIRRKRIIERDNLTIKEAELRMSAGKSDEFYIEKADYTIYNNDNQEYFLKEINTIFDNIYGGNLNV